MNRNRNRAKERLVTLQLIYIQKFAQTQKESVLLGNHDFTAVYQVYAHVHDLERSDPISNYHNNL